MGNDSRLDDAAELGGITMAELKVDFTKMAQNVAEKAMQELRDNGVFVGRWIPVNEHEAMFPCLATDKFGQIFIPISVVTIGNRCYDGQNFRFDVGDFLKGEEIEVDGETMYLAPREIVAWMPLPEPWKGVKDGRTEKDPV